jgi:hypothetical protein
MQLSKRDIRQRAYLERGRSARRFARILVPLMFLTLGTAIWQDPDLGPQLAEGLEVIRPTAASFLVDTPLEDFLGPVPEDLAQNDSADDRIAGAALPQIATDTN